MARWLWKGSLSFGLVNVPIVLASAVRDRGVHFRQLHGADGSPVETRRVCATEDREVSWDEIAKGYELDDGRWVLLTDEDLEAAAPRQSRTIDIESFVDGKEIDPMYLDHPYLLAPADEGAARAYALLSDAMRDSGRVALGRFVMRGRERMVSIRHREGGLTLTTMRFHEEIRSAAEIAEAIEAGEPAGDQVERAVSVIEELGVGFDAASYRDEHRAHLRKIIKSKQQGKKIAPPAKIKEPVTTAPDLMGALEESLAQIRGEKAGRATRKPPAKPKPRSTRPAGKSGSGPVAKRS